MIRGLKLSIAGFAALVVLAIPSGAMAADYRIGDTSDGAPVPGDCQIGTATPDLNCSLRDAVAATEATTAADRIFLDPGTYTLAGAANDDANQSGDIDLAATTTTGSLSIEATNAAANPVIVQAAPNDRIFDALGGNTASFFAINGLILENGNVTGTGGAIRSGTAVSGGNLSVDGSAIRNNRSTAGGGAIDFTGVPGVSGARLTLGGSALTGNNSGTGSGAAILSDRETHIFLVTISGNGKTFGPPSLGGGVMLDPYGATPRPPARPSTRAASTTTGRSPAAGWGSASAIESLSATARSERTRRASGLFRSAMPARAFSSRTRPSRTTSVLSATASDPASFYLDAGATPANVTVRNTIIATNDTVNDNCRNQNAAGGAFTSLGNNIQFGRAGDPSCAVTPHASDRTVDPLLPANGVVMSFGFIYLPAAGSPAIDTGAACEANTGSTTDQLFQPRTQGVACDVGAVEQAAPPPPAAGPATTPPTGQRAAALKKCKRKKTKKARKKCRKKALKLPV